MAPLPRSLRPGRLAAPTGHSLIELMIGVAIVGAILIGITVLLRETLVAYNQGSAAADLQGDVRAALDQITHDLRRAGRNGRGTCVFATFPSGNATSFQLQRDLDNLGTPPGSCIDTASGSEEQIRFTYNSGAKTITRQAGSGAATILARNVEASGAVFTYWHLPISGGGCASGALASTTAPTTVQLNCTRRMTINVRGVVATPAGSVTRAVRTDVDLRSR